MHKYLPKLPIILVALVVLLLPSFGLAQSPTREVKVQLTSTSEINSARLFVDGIARGFVRKGIANTMQLTLGQHSFALQMIHNGVEYKREKSENIIAGTTPQLVFLHPIRQATTETTATREVKIQLTSTSEVDLARLYIDGVNRGIIRKSTPLVLRLPLGTYKFAMQAVKDGVTYKREKTAAVVAGTTAQWEFLHPIRQATTESNATREVKIQLTSTSEVDEASLFIDGANRGIIRKSTPLVLRLPLGTHKFAMQAVKDGVTYKREKTAAVVAGTTAQWEFLHPIRQGGTESTASQAWVSIILDRASPVNRAHLTINGKNHGQILRAMTGTKIGVTPGEETVIVLTREWKGKTYTVEKKVTVAVGQTEVVRLVPVKQ